MNKTFKKVLSVVLALAMVVTSITVTNTAKAATEADYESWLKTERNLAYDQAATGGPKWREGTESQLTDGTCNLWDNYGAITVDGAEYKTGYFEVSLGDTYSAASIDQVVVWWRTGEGNFYPKNYYIQFGVDGSFRTVSSVAGDDYTTPTSTSWPYEADGEYMVAKVLDKEALSGNVDSVRIYIDTPVAYGAQATEIAVFAEDPQGPVEVEAAENAAGVEVSSNDYNTITYKIDGGDNPEGYVYDVYLDETTQIGAGVSAGVEYTVEEITAGEHTLKVVSSYNNGYSTGIYSEKVVVKHVTSLITSEYDIAYTGNNSDAKIIEPISMWDDSYTITTVQNALNGSKIDNTSDAAPIRTASSSNATIYIDLGADYTASQFEKLMFVVPHDRIHVTAFTVSFASSNSEYISVGSYTNTSYVKYGNALACSVNFGMSNYTEKGVRYVKIDITGGGNNGTYGYGINEIGVILNTTAPTTVTQGAAVETPAAVTATAGSYTVTAVVTGAEGHDDYTYEVSVAGQTKRDVAAGEEVTFTGIAAGTYNVTARSVDADGNKSVAISTEVKVEAKSVYTNLEMGDNKLFPDTNDNGNNYLRYGKVSATASSEINNNVASNVFDNTDGKWESEQGVDPQTITVNLGYVYSVKEVAMTWETANAKSYTVEVSEDGTTWTTVAMVADGETGERRDSIVLNTAVMAQYVKVTGTSRNTGYGYSIYEMAIYGADADKTPTYTVTLGETATTVKEGSTYTFANDYVIDGVPYKAGTVTVTEDITAETLNVNISMLDGASIKLTNPSGMRFMTTVNSTNVSADYVQYGTVIGAADEVGTAPTLDNAINIVTQYWATENSYIGAIVNIDESNMERDIVARGYAKIAYANAEDAGVVYTNAVTRNVDGVLAAANLTREDLLSE